MIKTGYIILFITLAFSFLLVIAEEEIKNNEVYSNSDQPIEHSEDKDFKNRNTKISYRYNLSGNSLYIRHENVQLRCVSDQIHFDVEVSNDTISICERITGDSLTVSHNYDLEIEIAGVPKRKYLLNMIIPQSGNQFASFIPINLIDSITGSFIILPGLFSAKN